ncbi:formate dehydrogenase accessory sulfurtransferase FdhD [Hyphococcus luteus]|uniref:Sulfurtransferase FdhD n=1 Tax=Hyphococcus luteus TaxID=2058213 RepID=A0A2S7K386_9PROT|nr:formate dehydrogenase accessory sulfurtransferase FdhD [Marinicaulis flavus]PQA86908.1 sulfurtransferase FdhD [Marinicaulis flavus]
MSKGISFTTTGDAPPLERETAITDGAETGQWHVPEETPVAFVYNQRNYAVMLATPADMEDFAVGFTLTERVVDAADEISSVDIRQSERGVELHIAIAPEKLERLDIRQQRRNLVGRAGCGVCGLENAETFFETLPKTSETAMALATDALTRALGALRDWQPLNQLTKTVHGAAWASLHGEILLAREDVGRHNALDKLLGALARNKTEMADGFVLMSSRCSYEIIEKSARLGVRAVASVSGPTGFAIAKAKEANIALYCRNGNSFVRAAP